MFWLKTFKTLEAMNDAKQDENIFIMQRLEIAGGFHGLIYRKISNDLTVKPQRHRHPFYVKAILLLYSFL